MSLNINYGWLDTQQEGKHYRLKVTDCKPKANEGDFRKHADSFKQDTHETEAVRIHCLSSFHLFHNEN